VVLNRFLTDEGFSIHLEPFCRDLGEFGVVSILDVLVKWLCEGEVTNVTSNGSTYPAFRLKQDKHRLYFYKSNNHREIIVRIETQTNDFVYITMSDSSYSSFALLERVSELGLIDSCQSADDYDRVVIPMVDLGHEVDISWLAGMKTICQEGHDWHIAQALQQTKFKMNEIGAHVKSAVAISTLMGCLQRRKELVIDRPFLIWIQRQGISIPLFSGWIAQDTWKNPGSLKM